MIRQTRIQQPALTPGLRLHLADRVFDLWHAVEAELGSCAQPPPYWGFAWPGGQAIARFLLDHPEWAAGRRVLDLGAGCGIAALAAVQAGAMEALASDIDRFAQAAIGLNAALNGVAVTHIGDVLGEAGADLEGGALERADLVLVGDMCYEKPLAARITQAIYAVAARGGTVLLADPGRSYLPVAGLRQLAQLTVPTSLDLEDRTSRETKIWQVMG